LYLDSIRSRYDEVGEEEGRGMVAARVFWTNWECW